MGDVNGYVGQVSEILEADLDSITREISVMFTERIPEFRHDEVVRRLMNASVASNLSSIFTLFSYGLDYDDVNVPHAAAAYARRFAQLDLPAEALLRAYRLGEQGVLQLALNAVETMELDAATALATISLLSSRLNDYIDAVIAGIVDIYEEERRAWIARDDTFRRTQIVEVLNRRDLANDEATKSLGMEVSRWHVAAIAWVAVGSNDSGARLRSATVALAAASNLSPFFVMVDDQTLWLWVSDSKPPNVDRLALAASFAGEDVKIALGQHAHGLVGFRQTLHEAERARAVALESQRIDSGGDPTNQLVWHHDEMALSSLVSGDFDGARQWAGRVLGPLAATDESTERLRATALKYLTTGRSHASAAAALDVHRNTIAYRITQIEELIGEPLDRRRLDIEVALQLFSQLGPPLDDNR